jgi:hemolysin activation/secretion protein
LQQHRLPTPKSKSKRQPVQTVHAQAAASASDPSAQFQRAQQQIDQLRQRNEASPNVLDAAVDAALDEASTTSNPSALAKQLPTNETPCWPIHRIEL